jgi:hypothetical protein
MKSFVAKSLVGAPKGKPPTLARPGAPPSGPPPRKSVATPAKPSAPTA